MGHLTLSFTLKHFSNGSKNLFSLFQPLFKNYAQKN